MTKEGLMVLVDYSHTDGDYEVDYINVFTESCRITLFSKDEFGEPKKFAHFDDDMHKLVFTLLSNNGFFENNGYSFKPEYMFGKWWYNVYWCNACDKITYDRFGTELHYDELGRIIITPKAD